MDTTSTRARWIPAIVSLGAFLFFSAVIWLFSDELLLFFLGYSPEDIIDPVILLAQTKTLMFGFVSALVGVFCFFALAQYNFGKETSRAVQQMTDARVADLTLSATQTQLLYDNSPVPYFVMDDEGNVRNANKATIRFFSANPDDFQVANLYSLIAPGEQIGSYDVVQMLVSKVQRGIAITDEEVTFKTYNNAERIALVSVYSLARDSKLPFKHLVALRDVTKEREAEEIKTDFLLLASHQLRTPTTTIKWYVDYLLDSKSVTFDDTVREYLQEVYSANERMMDLVRTLLTVSRIEMGTLEPEYTQVVFGKVIDDVLDELAPDITKKEIRVIKNIEHEGSVVSDQTMMRIAVHNLLTNAIKYTPKMGEVHVNVVYTNSECTIEVKDSGYGIPANEQEHIFSKMFRASNAKKVSANGTGLGLYLTRSFVGKLGGSISFESLEGKGTIFTVVLPRVAPDA